MTAHGSKQHGPSPIPPSTMRTWRWPVFFAVSSAAGLTSALLGDGVWDAVSWFALAAPLVVCLWCAFGRSSSR